MMKGGFAIGEFVERAQPVLPGKQNGNDGEHQQVRDEIDQPVGAIAHMHGENFHRCMLAVDLNPGQEGKDGKAGAELDKFEIAANGAKPDPQQCSAGHGRDGGKNDDYQDQSAKDGQESCK
jgi:hypothetical protein